MLIFKKKKFILQIAILFQFSGNLLAVHTSSVKITTCEILPDGKFIILALRNQPNLVTLRLKNGQRSSQLKEQENDEDVCYGNPDNDKKTFQL